MAALHRHPRSRSNNVMSSAKFRGPNDPQAAAVLLAVRHWSDQRLPRPCAARLRSPIPLQMPLARIGIERSDIVLPALGPDLDGGIGSENPAPIVRRPPRPLSISMHRLPPRKSFPSRGLAGYENEEGAGGSVALGIGATGEGASDCRRGAGVRGPHRRRAWAAGDLQRRWP